MRTLFTSLVVALVLVVGSTASHAQATKYAQAGMTFLKIDPGARSSAMGGASMVSTGTAEAMFSNPAGLAMLSGGDFSAGVTQWIADINLYSLAAAYKVGNIGTFGVNLVQMDYGAMRRTIPYSGADPVLRNQGYIDLGTFEVGEYAVGLTYARQITGQFYVGGSVRIASQDLFRNPSMGPDGIEILNAFTGDRAAIGVSAAKLVFDFGTLYYPGFKDFRFGASLRNFSDQVDYFDQRFELPLTLGFGAAMDVLTLASESSSSKLTVALDWLHPRDYEERLHIGLEYGFMDTFFVRGGYKVNYDEEDLTAGVGVRVDRSGYGIKADYGYANFGTFFGSVNRVNIGILLP